MRKIFREPRRVRLGRGWRSRERGGEFADDGVDEPRLGGARKFLRVLDRVVDAPAPQWRVNIRLGTSEYPKKEAADPSAFALKVRRQLTDDQRSLRIFGSEVVIGRLTGDATRVRLHLLNYGGREIGGLRIRLRGRWAEGEAFVAGRGRAPPPDHVIADGATEFSLPAMGPYAVIDLPAAK